MDARLQSPGEEIANSLIHGIALLAVAIAVPVLIVTVVRHGGAVNVAAASVFATTMILLYLTSTVYHALPASRAKRLFLTLDHGTIYLFIAGSYTPFVLGVLGGPWGWTLFGLEWGLAATGVALRAFTRFEHPTLSTGLYLAMGWLVLIAVVPLVERIPAAGVALLVARGVAYTAGVVFFVLDSRLRYAHAIWHVFVIAGTSFHFFAVLGYAA
jgi:hemolysin III